MRAFLKFLINLALIGAVIWLVVRFTTLDDKIIEFFTKKSPSTVSCTTPRGASIPNGASIFAYATADAGDGECTEEARTCKNGILDGTYTYQACSTHATGAMNQSGDGGTDGGISAVGASCDTPRGQTIEHGNYIVAYESPSSCTFQRRMCVDGKLLGKFMYNYCIIAFNGGSSAVGVTTYNSPYSVDNAFAGGYPQNGNANLNGMSPEQFSNAVNGQNNAAIYNSNIALTSPYANQGSWQYTPVNYGGNIANQQLPDDYWNQNTNGNVSFIRSRSDNKTNPLATQGYPSNYNGVRDWNYNNYDLTQKGCKSPWGSFVENGQYVIAYKTSAPSTRNGSCEYERRTCFNGQLNGSFGYASCSMPGKVSNSATRQYGNQGYDNYYRDSEPTYTNNNRSCRTPRGAYIANGDYVRSYKYAAAPWANGCEGEIRYCRNGVLDGSYGNRTCTLKTPPYPGCYGWECSHSSTTRTNSCNLPRGGTIYNGQSVVAYYSSYGSCYSERRTCSNGRLNGSYNSQYCYNNNHTNYNSCYLPRGGYISDGQSVRAYRVGYNGECVSENRYCSNGNLQGSYSMQSCSNNNNQSCSLPWGGYIGDGQSVEAYSSSSGPCLKESRQCRNGTLYGSYDYQSCYLQPTAAVDQYGDRQDMGRFDSVPNSSDTCTSDAIATFSCQSQDQITCTDYRKVATECCGGTRGRYERRTVTCNR